MYIQALKNKINETMLDMKAISKDKQIDAVTKAELLDEGLARIEEFDNIQIALESFDNDEDMKKYIELLIREDVIVADDLESILQEVET